MNLAKSILTVAAIASTLSLSAQSPAASDNLSPLASGYIQRARQMHNIGNYAAAIDQLRHIDTHLTPLSETEAEEYTYLLAQAYYERGDEECLRLLIQFRNDYPASPLALQAALAVGDFYFFENNWADALEAYSYVDLNRLNRDQELLYSYRRALCLINTGYFSEARTLINKLKGIPQYKDAYYFYLAYLDYIDGNFKQAYSLFSKVKPGIKGLDAGYYIAQIDYTWGNYDKVISNGTAILRNNPDPKLAPEIARIVGLSYFKNDDLIHAEQYLKDYFASTQVEPAPDALYAIGAIEYEHGGYASASQRFESVCNEPGALGQGAWLYLGQCRLKAENDAAAAMAFEKAANLNFDSNVTEAALYNYVTSLTRGSKIPFSSSSTLLENFIQKFPYSEHTPQIKSYLATAYYNDRNYDKALSFIDAIKNPTQSDLAIRQKILYELGVQSMSNGNPDKATNYLRQAVSLRRYDRDLAAQASLWLGDALFQLGNYKEARNAYDSFIKDSANSVNRGLGYYNLGYANYKLENYSTAASNFATALKSNNNLPDQLSNDATVRRADCLYYIGNYSEASSLFSSIINDDDVDADYALYRRAILYGLAGNSKAKLADLKRIESDYPSSRWLSKALLEEALTYEESGQANLAAEAYRKRLNVAQDIDIDELLRMASSMYQAQRWEDLLLVTEKIKHAGGIEADELADIYLYEADALANTGAINEAKVIYSSLAENPASLPGAKAAVELAQFEIDEKDYEAARIRMEEFTEIGSPHQYWLARGFIALADAYHGLGEKSLAKEYILSLKDNYPGDEADIKSMISSRLKKW